MKTKNKKIAQEIQSRILTIVIAIFMIVSIVVAIMVGNISLSAQKNDLQMQSKAASYQLEIFFQEYCTEYYIFNSICRQFGWGILMQMS